MTDSSQKPEPTITERGRRRLTNVIILSIVVILLLLSLIAQGSFNPEPFLMPDTSGETLLLYALTSLNFLAFVTVLFILMRHTLKLAQERRAGRPGSRFKTRMVGYAIGLSLLPALLLFFFAYGLLNRSIDRWFGEPARKINGDAKTLEESYFSKEEAELGSIGRAMTHSLNLASRSDYNSSQIKEQMGEKIREHNLMFARLVIAGKRINFGGINDQARPVVRSALREAEQMAVESLEPFTSRYESQEPRAIYFVAASRISDAPGDGRLLIIAREFPPELTRLSSSIDEQHRSFHNMAGKIKRIKTIYVLLLGAVTLLLIFTANWLALYVARGVTVPIQALAEATDRVARGDFTRPVAVAAEDELATLVSSFNLMSGQISENRERLEHAAEDLRRTNQALDNRRRYIETVLESLSTGVISADENTRMATINRAALSMLGLEDRPEIGTPIDNLVGEQGANLATLCRRARRSEIAQSEIEFKRQDGSLLQTATTAIALRNSEGNIDGFVVVIEDLTDLIQAERAAAWSEVARRMAHEIKNPLTPIQLSAERIMRNYDREMITSDSSRFDKVVTEGTSTIVREVATLQRMVEEFSRFARLPEARPVDTSLNEVISDAVALYAERLDGIQIDCRLADDLPLFRLDPEQIKRVMVNLIDNAIESLGSNSLNGNGSNGNSSAVHQKRITIETRFLKDSENVRLVVSDTGHGIRPVDRGKLFLPKFSTRDRGTGLGLAIVSHIVADHKGRIWVEDNRPRGARFVIELPAGR